MRRARRRTPPGPAPVADRSGINTYFNSPRWRRCVRRAALPTARAALPKPRTSGKLLANRRQHDVPAKIKMPRRRPGLREEIEMISFLWIGTVLGAFAGL